MSDRETFAAQNVSEKFSKHVIFKELDTCIAAYETLVYMVLGYLTPTRAYAGNIDTEFFDSIAGTTKSIKSVLLEGRIADAYTLLRRASETARMQIHVMLCLEDQETKLSSAFSGELGNIDSDSFLRLLEEWSRGELVSEDVEEWLSDMKSLKAQKPSKSSSATVSQLHSLFSQDHYKAIFNRCNDHVHLNFFRNLRLNAPLNDNTRIKWIEQFSQDFRDLVIYHIAYIFTIHPEYMMSSDYVDHLECGITPPEGSQYWVASIVQELFDSIITPYRPDIVDYMKSNLKYRMDLS